MKNTRILITTLILAAFAATGYALSSAKPVSAAASCCPDNACCSAGAACCSK